MKKAKTYFWLFGINLFISSFTFGGGYVVIPMIRKYFVYRRKCFSEEELMDMAAVAQSSPGAIAVNLSVLAGRRAGGLPGAVLSGLGAVIPPLVILSAISFWYAAFRESAAISALLKGMEAGAAALIVDAVGGMFGALLGGENKLLPAVAAAAFLGSCVFKLHALWVLAAGCLCNLLFCLFLKVRRVS